MGRKRVRATYENITDFILKRKINFSAVELVSDGKEWYVVEKKNALQRLKERYGKKKTKNRR